MKELLSLFIKVESYEDCPIDTDLLCWDGCEFYVDYVTKGIETGNCYPANMGDFISYIELPCQDEASLILGNGE